MTRDIADIIASPGFGLARASLAEGHDRFVAEIIELTEIPAPPFKEAVRAARYEAMLRDAGLAEVGQDAIGNVTGLRRGRGNGRTIVVAAHLDTVFPEGTDVTVRREGTRLYAPGVGDDTRGLAALLAYIRALDAGGIVTEHDLLFVGDVGEEGKGDLRGIRHLFAESPHRDRIDGFFTVDGTEMDQVTTRAVGSLRYRVTLSGPGGHSFSAFGAPNPFHAMGHVLSGMAGWQVPADPRTTFCASTLQGGTSVNAIPEQVTGEFDLRSVDPGELARLDAAFLALVEAGVAGENARVARDAGRIVAEITRIGDRPAGQTAPESPIVQATLAALGAFGYPQTTAAGSTDANIPMSLGIPAIRLGHGGTSGRAHSLDEWIDVAPSESIRGLATGLAAILGTAGMVP